MPVNLRSVRIITSYETYGPELSALSDLPNGRILQNSILRRWFRDNLPAVVVGGCRTSPRMLTISHQLRSLSDQRQPPGKMFPLAVGPYFLSVCAMSAANDVKTPEEDLNLLPVLFCRYRHRFRFRVAGSVSIAIVA